MALSDRLAQRPVAEFATDACTLGKLLAELPPDELAALNTMLGTPDNWGWAAPEIYEALKAEGHAVGFKAINKHRGGKCRCARAAA